MWVLTPSELAPNILQSGREWGAYTRALMSVRASMYLYKSEISYVMLFKLGLASRNLFSKVSQMPKSWQTNRMQTSQKVSAVTIISRHKKGERTIHIDR
jgi:hypothetical protein